jgi:hypothetical protein
MHIRTGQAVRKLINPRDTSHGSPRSEQAGHCVGVLRFDRRMVKPAGIACTNAMALDGEHIGDRNGFAVERSRAGWPE